MNVSSRPYDITRRVKRQAEQEGGRGWVAMTATREVRAYPGPGRVGPTQVVEYVLELPKKPLV